MCLPRTTCQLGTHVFALEKLSLQSRHSHSIQRDPDFVREGTTEEGAGMTELTDVIQNAQGWLFGQKHEGGRQGV
jgi:hypothetical protein